MSESGAARAHRTVTSEVSLLAERAGDAFVTLARRGATLALGVAIIALLAIGLAYGLGLAALHGTARSVWLVVGGVLLLIGVLWPLRAAIGLRRLPRLLDSFVGELETLLGDDREARHVVIDTVEAAPTHTPSGRVVPSIVTQSQRFTSLRQIAVEHADLKTLRTAAQQVASAPGLAAISLLLTFASLFLILVFGLLLIF